MRITYLDNSGFTVFDGGLFLMMDYCNPKPAPGAQGLSGGVVRTQEVEAASRSLALFSHSHGDHYTQEAFRLPFDEILLSPDFPARCPGRRLKEGESVQAAGVTVRAFGSTDLGVSFLIDAPGGRLFHAGDFNFWHWMEESTQEEVEEALEQFDRIMATLLPYAGTIDVAFFPVDPRMGRYSDRGARLFIQAMSPKLTIPMHTQGDEGFAGRFVSWAGEQGHQAVSLARRGQSVQYPFNHE